MVFDPDAYLAGADIQAPVAGTAPAVGFDPDTYLAEQPAQEAAQQPPGATITSEIPPTQPGDIGTPEFQETQERSQRQDTYSQLDPSWQKLSNPSVNSEIYYEDLVDIMGNPTLSLEPEGYLAAREMWDAPTMSQAVNVMKRGPVRNRAYKELKKRNFSDDLIGYMAKASGPGTDEFLAQLYSDIPSIALGIVGAKVGEIAAPGSPLLGPSIGAGIGAGIGQGLDVAARSQTNPERTSQMGGSDVAREVGIRGLQDAFGEGVGRLAVRGASKLLAPAKDDMIRGATRLSGELEEAGKNVAAQNMPLLMGEKLPGVSAAMTPEQMTANKLIDTVTEMAENSFTGQHHMFKTRKQQAAALGQWTENVLDDFAKGLTSKLSPSEMAVVLDDAVKSGRKSFSIHATKLYGEVDRLAHGAKINTGNLKKEAARMLRVMTPTTTEIVEGVPTGILDDLGQPITRTGEVSKKLAPSLKSKTTSRILKDFANLPDEVPVEYLAQWRSDLLQVGFQGTDIVPGKAKGAAKHLAKEIDSLFDNPALGLNPDARKMMKRANSYWKGGKERFNSKLIKTLTRQLADNPEKAVKTVFRPKATEQIRKVKSLTNDKTWKQMKHAYLADLIDSNRVSGQRFVNGTRFEESLNAMGDDALRLIFDKPGELARVRDISDMARMVQESPGGKGAIFVRIMESGAAGSLISGYNMKRAIATLFAGDAIARFITSKTGRKLLTEGMSLPANSAKAAGYTGRLMSELFKIRTELDREKLEQKKKQKKASFEASQPTTSRRDDTSPSILMSAKQGRISEGQQ